MTSLEWFEQAQVRQTTKETLSRNINTFFMESYFFNFEFLKEVLQ